MSPYLTDSFGRQKTMLLLNIPFGAAWILLYFSSSLNIIYVAMTLLGLALGMMESAIFIYTAETSEPHLRGTLMATTGLFVTSAASLICFLGNVSSWRTAALISSIIPMLAFLSISQVIIFLVRDSVCSKGMKTLYLTSRFRRALFG